jgi:hypothetical protein
VSSAWPPEPPTANRLSLSGFTRNDQAAAPDILKVARPGDLVLRDLGCLVTSVLGQFVLLGILFLSRYLHGVNLHDPLTGQPFDLAAHLRTSPVLDLPLLLGPERVPVRLVALPVPEEVANLRRHRARTSAKRRHRSPPGREHLLLMGWNLFLTNVPPSIWPPKTLAAVCRLRWRIEIIFKTWKSHLGLLQLNCRTAALLQLSVLTKPLFCALVCRICDALELQCADGDHVSLLRLGRIFHTFGFGAPIFNRLSASSRPQSRLQVGAPDCWHFVRIMKYAGWDASSDTALVGSPPWCWASPSPSG